jgi:UDP-2,3-diacylglucosamine pyrophosphatase LpxH
MSVEPHHFFCYLPLTTRQIGLNLGIELYLLKALPMIIVSDAHINESIDNQSEFFRMLQALEKSDEDLVFLGDIFDLWIALPRYEHKDHRRFLSWCGAQKKFRRIGYIEGNHEYFLAEERRDFFTWCSDGPYHGDGKGNLFCHGDQINRRDRNYIWFRKMAKNGLTKTVLRLTPFGPEIVERLKARLKLTNLKFRYQLPRKEMERFALNRFESGDRKIFVGHFHQEHRFRGPGGRNLYTVPSWFGKGIITHFEERSGIVKHDRWTALLD